MKGIDWAVVWTAIGSIVAALTLLGGLLLWIFNSLKNKASMELDTARGENARLRTDLDARLRIPTFGLEAIRLTEIAAERRVAEIEEKYKQAIESKDETLADELAQRIQKIEKLQQQVEGATAERDQLQLKLQSAIVPQQPKVESNAVGLRTGMILLVRKAGKYGAVQAVDQSSDARGGFIKYAWWYQPDGTPNLLSGGAQSGFSEAQESYPGTAPMLKVGPLSVEWSMGGEGLGWVYFKGPFSSEACELAPTNETDISKIDASLFTFHADQVAG